MAHEIRLAGPWEISSSDDVWERCVLPYPADGIDRPADVRLRRKFHRPSGLSDQSRLAIVVVVDGGALSATVNGVAVEAKPDAAAENTMLIDVTQMLQEFNTVELTVPPSTTVTEVRLRIVEPNEG